MPEAANQSLEVLVVGAGPAGLALGRELQQRRIPFQILERGPAIGDSWRRMPEHLKLVSPWKATRLSGPDLRSWRPNREVTRAEFADYLADYARSISLPIATGTEVLSVRSDANDRFIVETSSATLSCRRVVNATGYFRNPHWPEIPGRTTTKIPSWHSADYRSAGHVARQLGGSDKHILIIGKRLSAGQIMVELVSAGFRVSLSHRAPIQFGSGPLAWWAFFRIHPWLEAAKLRWQGPAARGFDVRMPGGQARRLIESGLVQRFPAIERLEGAGARFENGAVIRPDGLLFATGFRPALGHLRGLGLTVDQATGLPRTFGMQSADVPGLYFLGLDHLRNFQSRFLRGIRNDAVILAEQLAASLSGRTQ